MQNMCGNWIVAENFGICYTSCGISYIGKKVREKMQKKFAITFNADSGVAQALRKYCGDHNIPINKFIVSVIAEKLDSIDTHSLSVAEIEEIERWTKEESGLDL